MIQVLNRKMYLEILPNYQVTNTFNISKNISYDSVLDLVLYSNANDEILLWKNLHDFRVSLLQD